jgi:hypothetical protein
MAQLWPKHCPNMAQMWSNNYPKHARAIPRAPVHARARTRARLLGGGGGIRTLVASHCKTPLTRLMGRCHKYIHIPIGMYVYAWEFMIRQPEMNYKKVRGEGAKFHVREHPEDMRPPPFFAIFDSTLRTCDTHLSFC